MTQESFKDEVDQVLEDLNRRGAELAEEFAQYRKRVRGDERDAFEGWAIMKIAGLQITMELAAEEVRKLVDRAEHAED